MATYIYIYIHTYIHMTYTQNANAHGRTHFSPNRVPFHPFWTPFCVESVYPRRAVHFSGLDAKFRRECASARADCRQNKQQTDLVSRVPEPRPTRRDATRPGVTYCGAASRKLPKFQHVPGLRALYVHIYIYIYITHTHPY